MLRAMTRSGKDLKWEIAQHVNMIRKFMKHSDEWAQNEYDRLVAVATTLGLL